MPDSFEKYKALRAAISEAAYEYNLRDGSIHWNANLLQWGYNSTDIEPNIEWWTSRIHPDDLAAHLDTLDFATSSPEGAFTSNYRFRASDGSYRYVSDRGSVIRNNDDQPISIIGAILDVNITHKFFEHNPQPMWAFHRETLQFLAVNEKAIQLYGYSRQEFLSMRLTDIRPPEDIPFLRSVIAAPNREHEGRSVWRHYTKAGQMLHVEVRTQDLDLHGQPARLAIMTDVSRRIAVEMHLREANKLDAIGQLAVGLAEDFNQLISTIQTLTRRTLNDVDSASPLRANLEAIDHATSRATSLTARLLTFATRKTDSPAHLRWATLIESSTLLLTRLLPPTITISFHTQTGDALVYMAASSIEQILLNLVTNARDAIIGPGTIRVTSALVTLSPQHPDFTPGVIEGEYIQLTVADSGQGMSPAVLSHLFEPFFTTKSVGQGNGLGLSTVYGIVRNARGIIRVDSFPGEGSEFRVYIPTSRPSPAPRTILLVEDESDLRDLLAAAMTAAGFEVITAKNGNEALSLVTTAIDLLVTDIFMPEVDGFDLIRKVRTLYPDLPIIAISSGHLRTAQLLGANLTLSKPLAAEDLLAAIQSLFKSPPTTGFV